MREKKIQRRTRVLFVGLFYRDIDDIDDKTQKGKTDKLVIQITLYR